jgi:riboflavin biosynthesis pyrimidine reductase
MRDELPEVVLTTTVSVDGRITLGRDQLLLDPKAGARWETITVPGAFETRHTDIAAQVILEGSGSFVGPDAGAPRWPEPIIGEDLLWEDHLPEEAARWFVVADSRGRVDWSFTGDADLKLHVLVCRSTPAGYLQRLRDLGVGYFIVGDERVDLRSALARIRHRLGATRVIADSGGTLNASLLRAGLVEIVDVVTLPGLVGGAGTPTMMDGPAPLPDEVPIRLQLIDVRVEGDAVRTRYRVRRADEVAGRKHGD